MAAGQGGRGARIAALLAAQQNAAPGSQSDATQVAPIPVARGRAAMLQNILQKQDIALSSQEAAPVGGRGRACRILQAQQETSQNGGQMLPPASRLPPPAEPLVGQMQAMTVAERSPTVIRRGETGKPLPATANFIRLLMKDGRGVFDYEVRFDPSVDDVRKRIRYLKSNLRALSQEMVYDGGATLYMPVKLDEIVTTFQVDTDHEPVQMKIIYKKKRLLSDCTHLYNVLFKRMFDILEFVYMQRANFNPLAAVRVPQHKLEIWPGYCTSVDEYEDGIMLCCDSSHRVLRMQTVLDLIRDLTRQNLSAWKDNLKKEVCGMSVLTRYNNKLYRVDDVDFGQTPLSTFPSTRRGITELVKYKDYYQKQYTISITDDGQPLLLCKVKNTGNFGDTNEERLVCLVPELCYLTGLTDQMRADFKVMKDIATHTRITPNQRQAALTKLCNSINANEQCCNLLGAWGLTMAEATVNILARVMPPEDILFRGARGVVPGTRDADWGNSFNRQQVLEAVNLEKWFLVFVGKDRRLADDFVGHMLKLCPQMGICCTEPKMVVVPTDRIDSFLCCLKENNRNGAQIAVIICPSARDDRYAAIKKLCCADQPIPSQVINARTISRPDKNRSIVQKIALQINCKLGGTLWSLKMPFKDIMVVGIDTYHDGTQRGSSVGGFVASINKDLTRWYSRVCIQLPSQELIDNLKVNFIQAINRYFSHNHEYPGRIIIYRDGVGDGQLNQTKDYEVAQFQSCFTHIDANYCPKLTVVVCQKRINTRIFQTLPGRNNEPNLDNPPPGTVVDNTINRRLWYDFFLVSQHVRQGTVTPTHYVVVHDGCEMKTDHLQRLTYKLCHLYYNWPGTIRVPAPVQYAHKLAQLVGQNIHRAPADCLEDKLYFL